MTYGGMARMALGTMVAFVLVAAAALLWMARRVRGRGHVGRQTGMVLRSVLPVVLGLGGWFAAALAALTVAPGVPLDAVWLSAPAVASPIALGVTLAWVHRAWPRRTMEAGFATAAAGAVVGAWLAFHAASGSWRC